MRFTYAHFRSRSGPAHRGSRRRLSALLATMLMAMAALVGVTTWPAAAAGSTTITKQLDSVQNAGFTAPDTFQVGALVRYRLTASCSSNTVSCGVASITDVLDPRLEYVEVLRPAGAIPTAASFDAGTSTVSITVGNAATPFPDGGTAEFTVVARVRSDASGTIPNQSSITNTSDPGVTNESQIVSINVPAGTPDWKISKFVDGTSIVAQDSTVRYYVQYGANKTLGNIAITGGTLVDYLPPGSEFVTATDNGVYDPVAHTVTWQIDPMNPATGAGGLHCTAAGCTKNGPAIEIRFPAANFPNGAKPVNKMTAFPNYANGTTGELNGQATITIQAAAPGGIVRKSGNATVAANGLVQWWLQYTNSGNTALGPVTFVDTLPPTSQVSKLFVSPSGLPTGASITKVEALKDGTWTNIALLYPAPIPAGSEKVRITVDKSPPSSTMTVIMTGTVGDLPKGTEIVNCLDGTGTGVPTQTSCHTMTVAEPHTKLAPAKQALFPGTTQTSVQPGGTAYFGINYWHIQYTDPASSVEVTDVLPKEFEYVRMVCGYHGWGGTNTTAIPLGWGNGTGACDGGTKTGNGPMPEPTATSNPDGSTTLHWTINAPTNANTVPANTFTNEGWVIYFEVRAKEGTATASYTNKVYESTPNGTYECTNVGGTTTYDDTTDVDNNPATDTLCANSADIIVDRLAQADVYKWVKGNIGENVAESTGKPDASCPDWDGYTRFPCVATLTPGGTFDYRFRAVNTGNQDLSNWVVYDILPHTGDVGVNEALVNAGRGTKWTPTVTGPLVLDTAAANNPLPSGANPEIRYSTSYNPCRPEMGDPPGDTSWLGGCDSTWYTEAQIEAMAGGWASVKSFKVEMFQGNKAWSGGDDLVFKLPMVAPSNAPTSTESPLDLSIAWNSIGHQGDRLNANGTTEFLPAAAPRKVGVIVPFVLPKVLSIGDYVWWDNNRNGLQDSSEPPVPEVTVELWNADGTAKLQTTTTDADGYYSFLNLLVDTEHTLKFIAPNGASWTTQKVAGGSDALNSDVDPTTGQTTFTTPSTPGDNKPTSKADGTFADVPTYDAGLVKYNLQLDKKLETAAPFYPGQTVTFTLTPNNEGPATAKAGWSVTDVLPAGLTAVSMTGAGYTCTLGTLTCYAQSDLAGGATGNPITVKATIDATATGTLKNVAYVNKATDDVPETVPLGTPPTTSTDTAASITDNDDEVPLTLSQPVRVGDYVWLDENRDGIQQPGNDVPVQGATLSITTADGSPVKDIFGNDVTTTTTDSTGKYLFENLPAGQYKVTFVSLPASVTGYVPTLTDQGTTASDSSSGSATSVVLPPGAEDLSLDFGFKKLLVSIGDHVWFDTDRDGIQDTDEAPVPGVSVELFTKAGVPVGTTTTDANGFYSFNDLLPDTDYSLVFTKPDGTAWTVQNAGTDDAVDSDVKPADGTVAVHTPTTGENSLTTPDDPSYDGGLVQYNLRLAKTLDTAGPFTPGDEVTFTLTPHNDGPTDALAGWSVTEVLPATLTLVSMTGTGYDCSGVTCVAQAALKSGTDGATITVKATIKAGATGRIKNVAYVDKVAGDVPETNPLGNPPTTATDTGTTPTDNDAEAELGVPLVSIGDYVWFDTNRDGIQQSGESPVPGVQVELRDASGVVNTTTTDVNGFYSFVNLAPNTDYTLVFTRPDGTTWTVRNAGADDAADSDVVPSDGTVAVHTPKTGSNSPSTPDDPTYDGGLVQYNLTLAKTLDSSAPYYSGQTVTFTLTPHNDGPTDALAGWSVHEVLPKNLTLKTMTGDGYACEVATATCVADAVLAAGADGKPITVTATIAAGFTGTMRNVAYVAPDATDAPETNPLVVPEPGTDTSTTPTDNDADVPLAVQTPVKVGDYVWVDRNRDGRQDASDVPVKGATLTLSLLGAASDAPPVKDIFGQDVLAVKTDANGHYLFDNLPEGTYVVTVDPSTAPRLAGTLPTTAEAGTDRAKDSSTGSATSVELTSAGVAADLTLDFGFIDPAVQVGDRVWFDSNHDGLQSPGEKGIAGVTLTLVGPDGAAVTDVTGKPVGPITTDKFGDYVFALLPVLAEGKSYTVLLDSSTLPKGYRPTLKEQGADRAVDSSTGKSVSWLPLTSDGAEDMTLDFGFWIPGPSISIRKDDVHGNAADTKAEAVVLDGSRTKLVFVVRNTGDETLRDIKVSDDLVRGGKVKNLTCTFPDGSTGVSWKGPFQPGDEFRCTAELTGVDGAHLDVASVTAVGEQSGTSVADDNPYHAVRDTDVSPPSGDLPQTGAGAALAWGVGVGLVLLGAGIYLVVPRRRRSL